jgi:hypothetical protein
MDMYLDMSRPLYVSSKNLFCLRYDLHLGGFDCAQFVIVPKSGQLVVHFLKASPEAANLYHNVSFDHDNNVSHEALYARFAWALIKIIKEMEVTQKPFNFQKPENDNEGRTPGASGKGEGGSGGGGQDMSGTRKRKRERGDEDGGEGEEGEGEEGEEGDGEDNGTYQLGGSTVGHRGPSLPRHDSWLSSVLLKISPGDSQSSIDADAREIEKDIKVAARSHPQSKSALI